VYDNFNSMKRSYICKYKSKVQTWPIKGMISYTANSQHCKVYDFMLYQYVYLWMCNAYIYVSQANRTIYFLFSLFVIRTVVARLFDITFM
jgi:hypothetical protein